MKVHRCVSCGKDYKIEPHPKTLITHGTCSAYCRQSARMWVEVPENIRPPLKRFHREREKVKAVA